MTFDREAGAYETLRRQRKIFEPLPPPARTATAGETFSQPGEVSPVQVNIAAFSDSNATLSTGTGNARWVATTDLTINRFRPSVGDPPTGASIILDVNLDGTTLGWSTPPTITAGSTVGGAAVPTNTTMAAGSYLTVDKDQVGSGTAGGYLTLTMEWQPS